MRKTSITRRPLCLFLVCLVGAAVLSPHASATIFLSGDSTPAYYADVPGNDVFFENILQDGTSVMIHDTASLQIGTNLRDQYNSLTGVSASYVSNAVITTDLLAGVDFFVTSLWTNPLSADELGALGGFLGSGGSILFMADGQDLTLLDDINDALAVLGSSMSVYGPPSDVGYSFATGSQIANDPFTAGVSSFRYGYTYAVNGGTSLFFDSGGRTIFAYESLVVPEPATLTLLGIGLAGLAGFRKKFMN